MIAHQPDQGGKPGRIIAVNKIACDRFGYTEEEFLKLKLVDINAPEARQNPVNAVKTIMKEGRVRLETVHITKDGRRIPVEVNAVLINYGGKPTVLSNSRDISEMRRRDEKERKQAVIGVARAEIWKIASDASITQEQLIQGLLEKIGPAMSAERVSYGAPAASDKFMITHEWKADGLRKFKGFTFPKDIFDNYKIESQKVVTMSSVIQDAPKMIRFLLAPVLKLIAARYGDKPSLMTPYFIHGVRQGIIMCTPAGDKKEWADVEKQLVLEAAQIISNSIERRQAEAEIALSEARYRALFEGVNDAVLLMEISVLGSPMRLLEVNKTACEMLGYSRQELLEKGLELIKEKPKNKKVRQNVKAVSRVYEDILITKDGRKVYAEVNASHMEYKGKRAILWTVRDISYRKAAADEEVMKNMLDVLRADIWKIAAESGKNESVMIQRLLERIGPQFGVSRASYGVSDGQNIVSRNQWNNTGVKPSREYTVPSMLLNFMKKGAFYEFGGQIKVDFIPVAVQGVVSGILEDLIKKFGLRSVIAMPVFIDGRIEGVLSMDVEAVNAGFKGFDNDKKAIILDLANIISQTTARIKAEKKIEESEKLYRELFNNSNDSVVLMEMEKKPAEGPPFARIVDFNDVTCEMFEISRKEMFKTRLDEFVGEGGMKRIRGMMAKAGAAEASSDIFEMTTKKGKKITAELRTRIFRFEEKTFILSVARDISFRAKAEQELKESEEKYRELYNNMNDGVFINEMDGEGRIQGFIELNEMACRITGYSRNELTRMTPRDLSTKEFLETYPGIGRSLAETGKATYEQELLRKDGVKIAVENNSHKFMMKGKPIVLTVMRDITERIKSRNEIIESEELYRTLVSTSPDAVIMVSLDGEIIFASDRMARIHGYENGSKLIGMSIYDFVAAESREAIARNLAGFDTGDTAAAREYTARKRNSTKFTAEINSSMLKDAKGRPKSIIATIRDVTARHAAEQALKESEERYRSVVSQTGLLVYEHLINTGVITWGGAVYKITGFTEDEFNREVSIDIWGQMIHPDDRKKTFDTMEKAQEECGAFFAEYRFRLKNGLYAYIEDTGVFLPDESGKAHKFIGVMKDITDRKKSENALKESEEKFRTLSDQSLLGIGIIQDGVFKYFNSAFLKINGCDREDVLSWKPGEFVRFIHPDDAEMVMEMAKKRQSGAEGNEKNYQCRMLLPAGRVIWVDVYAKSIIYDGRPADFMTEADITELKETEEKLRLTIGDLKRSNEELEQFAYVASHDLQEPLRMVSSYVQLLKKRYEGKLGKDADDFIGYAVDGADRMQKLIKDLLAFSRVGTKKKENADVDMGKVMEAVKNNLQPVIAETGAEISCGKLPVIQADELQMGQLLQNLIANSIKFRTEGKPPKVEIGAEKIKGMWVFSVKDNGIGIDKQYHEKIFVIFQRLHGSAEYPGTGIGLAICKKIVETHGGKMWVESEEGRGSVFYFSIPA